MIIKNELKECETCKRHFIKLDLHHITGNHKNNHKNNLINICKSCHQAIHKRINKRRNREYKLIDEEEDKNTNERIYDLRVKLYQAKYGNINLIPNDNITKIAKFSKNMNRFIIKNQERLKGVKEIIIQSG